MGIVLCGFPLKYGFIIVQVNIWTTNYVHVIVITIKMDSMSNVLSCTRVSDMYTYVQIKVQQVITNYIVHYISCITDKLTRCKATNLSGGML